MVELLIIGAIILVLFVFITQLYNSLVRLKNNVKESWSNIDVLLKQRHDELPKLISSCKTYMKYEKGTLQSVVEARNQVEQARTDGDINKIGHAETMLRRSVGGLFAIAENYPDLKANTTFSKLQSRISDLENQIADRRELYNDSVNLNNIRIEQFPAVLFASSLGFKPFDLLAFSEEEKADVDVEKLFED